MKSYHQELDLIQARLEDHFAERLAAIESEREYVESERADASEAVARLRRAASANGLGSTDGIQLTSFHTRPARTMTEAVNHVIRDFIVGDFDINTVIGFVIRHHPEIKQPLNPTSVSGILRSLRESEILEVAKEGAGPKPTIYRLTDYGRQQYNLVEQARAKVLDV